MIGCFNCPLTGVQLQPTVRLQLYRMISENGAADAPITFEEIVMVMIMDVISYLVRVTEQNKQTNGIKIIRAELGSSTVLKITFLCLRWRVIGWSSGPSCSKG